MIPATGANALAVAEYVIGTAMLLRAARTGRATRSPRPRPRAPLSAAGRPRARRWGSVGVGGIGRAVAAFAGALGMRTTATIRTRGRHAASRRQAQTAHSIEELSR